MDLVAKRGRHPLTRPHTRPAAKIRVGGRTHGRTLTSQMALVPLLVRKTCVWLKNLACFLSSHVLVGFGSVTWF